MRRIRIIAVVLALAAAVDAVGLPAYAENPTLLAAILKQQAARGDPAAQARIGWMYSTGSGVPQNYRLAARWYRRAAENGHGGAQFALGLLYNKGQGVPRNLIRAHMWINLSAAQATGEDHDFIVRIRDSIASNMTKGEVATAQRLAEDWHTSHSQTVVQMAK